MNVGTREATTGKSAGTKPIKSFNLFIFLRPQSKINYKIKSVEEISLVPVLKELIVFVIFAGCMKKRNGLLT